MYRHLFLTSAANESGSSASRPGSITPGKKNPDAHRKGDRMGSTVYLGALENLR